MIEFRLGVGVGTEQHGYDVVLSGDLLSVFESSWNEKTTQWDRQPQPVAEGQWDFASQALTIVEVSMPSEVIGPINERLGTYLRGFDVPRQPSLFPGGCSVCGCVTNTVKDEENIARQINLADSDSGEPVRWTCHVCGRRVCRKCTLVRSDAQQYYFHTYCCEACRKAAPPEFESDDETHL